MPVLSIWLLLSQLVKKLDTGRFKLHSYSVGVI
jgi:hypothetical protein